MQFPELLASLKTPYWAANLPSWSLRGVTCAKAVETGKVGVANLIWLVASRTDYPAGMVYAKVIQMLPARVGGYTLEHWAATGSLKLFCFALAGREGPREEGIRLAMDLAVTTKGDKDNVTTAD